MVESNNVGGGVGIVESGGARQRRVSAREEEKDVEEDEREKGMTRPVHGCGNETQINILLHALIFALNRDFVGMLDKVRTKKTILVISHFSNVRQQL